MDQGSVRHTPNPKGRSDVSADERYAEWEQRRERDRQEHDEPIFDLPAPGNLRLKAAIMENCLRNNERATPGDLGVWALTLRLCAEAWDAERADRLKAEEDATNYFTRVGELEERIRLLDGLLVRAKSIILRYGYTDEAIDAGTVDPEAADWWKDYEALPEPTAVPHE